MTIGEKIKTFRKKAGLTQKKLGELSGTSETTIKQYELGKRQPRIEQLRKIALALDVYTYDLLYDEEKAEEKKQQDFAKMSMELINEGTLELPNNDAITSEILLRNFNSLNRLGKTEACKRVGELTEIKKYTEPENN